MSQLRFVCVAAGHTPRLVTLDFGLSVHLRAWAFCPAGETTRHEWRRIDAIALEAVIAPRTGEAVVTAD
jgi:hypothetical protein